MEIELQRILRRRVEERGRKKMRDTLKKYMIRNTVQKRERKRKIERNRKELIRNVVERERHN